MLLLSMLKQKILRLLGRKEAKEPPPLHLQQRPLRPRRLQQVNHPFLGLRDLLRLRQSRKAPLPYKEKKGPLPYHRRQGSSKGRP